MMCYYLNVHFQGQRVNNSNQLNVFRAIISPILRVPPNPGYRPAASSVHYTTISKHSLVLPRIGEIIARNMLSWLELLINRYCYICLVIYIIVQWYTVKQTSNLKLFLSTPWRHKKKQVISTPSIWGRSVVSFTSRPLYPPGNSITNSPETKLSEPQSRPGRFGVPVTCPNKRLFNKNVLLDKIIVHQLSPKSPKAPPDFSVVACVDNAQLWTPDIASLPATQMYFCCSLNQFRMTPTTNTIYPFRDLTGLLKIPKFIEL